MDHLEKAETLIRGYQKASYRNLRGCSLNSSGSACEPVAGPVNKRMNHTGSTTGREFLELLMHHYFPTDSDPWT
jgi:hypothetical protein